TAPPRPVSPTTRSTTASTPRSSTRTTRSTTASTRPTAATCTSTPATTRWTTASPTSATTTASTSTATGRSPEGGRPDATTGPRADGRGPVPRPDARRIRVSVDDHEELSERWRGTPTPTRGRPAS